MSATPLARRRQLDRPLDTRERLLDAAEVLFAGRGFAGTSMRAITTAADASLSAVNYHFGSKEGLLHALLQRSIEPVNRIRLERLDALERGDAPSLEAVLDAFLRPAFELRAASPDATARFRQVAARLYSDPPELVSALKRELFQTIGMRFLAAIGQALPERRPEELALGWQFCVGVMVHAMSGHLESIPGTPLDLAAQSEESVLAQMVAFVAAGLRAAPLASPTPSPVGAPAC